MSKLFVPLVLLAELLGLVSCILIGLWMGRYLGGFAWDGSSQEFNLHPLLMTVSMVFLYGNATMIYRIFTGVDVPRIAVKATHAGALLLATIMMSVGLTAVFQNHNANGIPNLYSLHSWLGITTVSMFLLQLVLGLGIFLLPFASSQLRASYLSSHVFFGIAILSMAAATCLIGILEKIMFSGIKYSDLPAPAIIANAAGLTIVGFVITVAYILTTNKAASSPNRNYSNLH
ncbi:lysosomal membrane ascorbate-dependent ferrireductase CYB561A3-like [Lytechinus pictus]|uniref:cytochrome b ascorbate-dependent protein 3-like n=1 Tax=Lytechinus variegatus TaxID=7654 RepID=UPI001BB265A0|nr:cytochrome b ascorbate-dependent protein 3-like [Lytechinus variegatus]XP_054754439.1 lysosomal membrane ascorbate-dependent ferrireductase CYB561A3-like [Lytechinus pictus]XP_054754440.1 lysosomal membrane ascorbate-dependent ferrireductase CYB561A3-like [Lytechinus pictus]